MQVELFQKSSFEIEGKHTTHSGGKGEYLHDWYSYLEGFSSSFVNQILKTYAPNAEIVLEPFAGVGTTPVNSSILGCTSYYCEINPVLRKVTAIKNKILNLSDEDTCEICKSTSRNKQLICVVESVRDVMAIEDTGQFKGRYHILGGVISPLEGISPQDLTIEALLSRIKKEEIDELIMAISPTIEGETTIYYISKLLKDMDVKVSIIARGVSFGGDLEYADEFTLGRSITSRIPYKTQI